MTKKTKAYALVPVMLIDGAVIGGAAAVAYGAHLIAPAVGFIVGGALAMALGLLAGARV